MEALAALLVTLGVGCSFCIGALIARVVTNKKVLEDLAIGMAFVVMCGLLIVEFIPHLGHAFESVDVTKRVVYVGFYLLLGIVILKVLDYFIPTHHHDHTNEDDEVEHSGHLLHIGIITGFSLIIHNIIEGLSIYSIALDDLERGILIGLGVALHNIPLGVSIFASLEHESVRKWSKYLMMLILALSTFLGALMVYLFGGFLGEYMEGVVMSVTVGMVIYIALFELFDEYRHHIKSKYTIVGSVLGVLVLGISFVI